MISDAGRASEKEGESTCMGTSGINFIHHTASLSAASVGRLLLKHKHSLRPCCCMETHTHTLSLSSLSKPSHRGHLAQLIGNCGDGSGIHTPEEMLKKILFHYLLKYVKILCWLSDTNTDRGEGLLSCSEQNPSDSEAFVDFSLNFSLLIWKWNSREMTPLLLNGASPFWQVVSSVWRSTAASQTPDQSVEVLHWIVWGLQGSSPRIQMCVSIKPDNQISNYSDETVMHHLA